MSSWLGKSLVLEIERVAHGGHFIAHHEGRVIFVSGALPGETVRVEVTKDTEAKFCFAQVAEVMSASPHRVPHFWEAAARGAGGAEFGHIRLDFQRELKRQVLVESMSRFAGLETDVQVTALAGDEESSGLHYRTRLQLQAKAGQVGVMRAASEELVPVTNHPLAVEAIDNCSWVATPPIADGRFSLWVDSTGEVGWQSGAQFGGPSQLVQRVRDREFVLTPGTFWQAHRAAPELLFGWVTEHLRTITREQNPTSILELYSGAGLFTAAILDAVNSSDCRITSVERSQQAVGDAVRSLENPDGVEFWVGDVLEYLKRKRPTADLVVLDPPRSGASGKVTEQLLRAAPKSILYVACDPVALARDAGNLLKAGYRIVDLQAADMFPHTHHFETLVRFDLLQ